jgi:hypothetical protein
MLTIAHDLVARATRFLLAGAAESALWTISVRGRVVGSLVCEAGEQRRLAWFDGADRSLVNYAGPLDGDIDDLARVLGMRLGAPVELDQLPV